MDEGTGIVPRIRGEGNRVWRPVIIKRAAMCRVAKYLKRA